jgi:hypothetical protein
MIVHVFGVPTRQYVTVGLSDVSAADAGVVGADSVRVGFLLWYARLPAAGA